MLHRLKDYEKIPAVDRFVKMDDAESYKYRVEKVGSALFFKDSCSSSSSFECMCGMTVFAICLVASALDPLPRKYCFRSFIFNLPMLDATCPKSPLQHQVTTCHLLSLAQCPASAKQDR